MDFLLAPLTSLFVRGRYLLDRGMRFWRRDLVEAGRYHTLVRWRTDMRFPPGFKLAHYWGANDVLHAFTDKVFYSTPATFFRLFLPFYNDSVTKYHYHAPTDENVSEYLAARVRNGGLRSSCLLERAYAPGPRLTGLSKKQHTPIVHNPKSDHPMTYYCGCRFQRGPEPWYRHDVPKRFQSEPALAYHVLVRNVRIIGALARKTYSPVCANRKP